MRLTLALLPALALLGCNPTPLPYRAVKPERYAKLNESPRPMPARAVSSVTMYRTQPPEKHYVEVGEMVDVGENETVVLEKLKQSAAGLGCDGLIVGSVHLEMDLYEVNLSGTCIMFEVDPGTWRPPPSSPEHQESCAEGRAKLLATKDANERAAIARSMPPECHRE